MDRTNKIWGKSSLHEIILSRSTAATREGDALVSPLVTAASPVALIPMMPIDQRDYLMVSIIFLLLADHRDFLTSNFGPCFKVPSLER